MANQDTSTQPNSEKKSLVTRNAWIVISIISLLMALSTASRGGAAGPGEFIPFLMGGFLGGLLLLGGVWALLVLIFRWILRKRSVA